MSSPAPYLRSAGPVCECVVIHEGKAIVQEVPRGALLLMMQRGIEHLKATEILFDDCRPCDTEEYSDA